MQVLTNTRDPLVSYILTCQPGERKSSKASTGMYNELNTGPIQTDCALGIKIWFGKND